MFSIMYVQQDQLGLGSWAQAQALDLFPCAVRPWRLARIMAAVPAGRPGPGRTGGLPGKIRRPGRRDRQQPRPPADPSTADRPARRPGNRWSWPRGWARAACEAATVAGYRRTVYVARPSGCSAWRHFHFPAGRDVVLPLLYSTSLPPLLPLLSLIDVVGITCTTVPPPRLHPS